MWLSDSFCRLATGGGHAARRLYSDDDEILFDAQCPVILNGIEQVVTREDLADRAMFITLGPITPGNRIPERELLTNFEKDRAAIFGALLQMIAFGLRALPGIMPPELPRMADFAMWAIACEGAEWPRGTFEKAYRSNREKTVEAVIDADPVAAAVHELMTRTMQTMRTEVRADERAYPEWTGTASDLLATLRNIATEVAQKDGAWPKTANLLSNRLTRAIPFLRERGIQIYRTKEGHEHRRVISIRSVRVGANALSASSASSARETDKLQSDQDAALPFEEAEAVQAEETVDARLGEDPSPSSLVPARDGGSAGFDLPERKRIIVKRPKSRKSDAQTSQ